MPGIALKPILPAFGGMFWIAALGIGALFFAMRAGGTLGPVSLNFLLPLMCVAMVAVPWLLLSRDGRRQIGLQRARRGADYATGASVGVMAAAVCFGLGFWWFGTTPDHWYVSIANRYRQSYQTQGLSVLQLHLVFSTAACFFSPLGEEIFFRGFLQRTLEDRFSRRRSTGIEAGFFGLVHLCHHGVAVTAGGITLRPLSGVLWVLLMSCTALCFAWIRQRSASLWPAVLAHSSFNATMNVFIFAVLWT